MGFWVSYCQDALGYVSKYIGIHGTFLLYCGDWLAILWRQSWYLIWVCFTGCFPLGSVNTVWVGDPDTLDGTENIFGNWRSIIAECEGFSEEHNKMELYIQGTWRHMHQVSMHFKGNVSGVQKIFENSRSSAELTRFNTMDLFRVILIVAIFLKLPS